MVHGDFRDINKFNIIVKITHVGLKIVIVVEGYVESDGCRTSYKVGQVVGVFWMRHFMAMSAVFCIVGWASLVLVRSHFRVCGGIHCSNKRRMTKVRNVPVIS